VRAFPDLGEVLLVRRSAAGCWLLFCLVFLLPFLTLLHPIPIFMFAVILYQFVRVRTRCEFRERGIRWVGFFRSPIELHAADLRSVTFTVHATGGTTIFDPPVVNLEFRTVDGEVHQPLENVAARGDRLDRYLSLAERHSRPIAKRMWRTLREKDQVEWTKSLWLTRLGIARPQRDGREPEFLPFSAIEAVEVRGGRCRIVRRGAGEDFEESTSEPNFLAGRIVLDRVLARIRGPTAP
jgi:hypothetical protein